jgi:hypothetical protein
MIGFVTDASQNSARFAVRESGRAVIDEPSVARDQHYRADETLRVERAGQHRIDALGERGIGGRLQ